ncbi:MAG: aminoacyl-tRNA hydrolase [Proteobacteria bacterium]|nr:aminoacyl-tRNA hydrolase [Pseudomonadota bacterium]
MKLIVGLGNPGPDYAGTRHNVGFDVVDILSARWDFALKVEKFHGWFGKGVIRGEGVALLKPTTLMNRSGRAVLVAGRFYKLELEHLLVISDDLSLQLGRLRMRPGGSAGGHKGLQSIIDRLGTDDWCRLRIGIGAPIGDPSKFVLSSFDEAEETVVEPAKQRGADAVECWIENGADLTMTRFHGEPPPTP